MNTDSFLLAGIQGMQGMGLKERMWNTVRLFPSLKVPKGWLRQLIFISPGQSPERSDEAPPWVTVPNETRSPEGAK